MELSARNQLQGRVISVKLGSVMAEVQVDISGQSLLSVITSASAKQLALKAGDAVTVVIKATGVMIGK